MSEDPSMQPMIDFKKLRRREPGEVERWFLRFADGVYTFVLFRVGKDEELATEVVQETFLTALSKIEDYDPQRGAMRAWLTYTARNCIRDALKERRRAQTSGLDWQAIDRKLFKAFQELADQPLPDELLEKRQTAELVQMALANLPDNYRDALELHYCRQRSLAEIAAAWEMTEGAVKSLLHRARLAFKAAFQTIAESFEQQPPAGRVIP